MKVDLFDFELPQTSIAQHPARPKDSARLLVVGAQTLEDKCVLDLAAHLQPNDILVFNDTKVIPARLQGKRGEAGVEVTLHKRTGPDAWYVFARPGKKLKIGDTIHFADGLTAHVMEKTASGEVLLRFNRADDALMASLQRVGIMPLPPYIKRPKTGEAQDGNDYQTLFATHLGAVAAPTAGLHFTDHLMETLHAQGIKTARITLHVGAGTFLPVKVEDTQNHKMHSEWGEISPTAAAAIQETQQRGGRVVAVGTTSLRLLESAAQDDGTLRAFSGETDIFITPGYRFKIVDVLMSNFHLPKSTLFMLVSAFAGLDRMKAAYAHAIKSGYRFYSYGDACLLRRNDDKLSRDKDTSL